MIPSAAAGQTNLAQKVWPRTVEDIAEKPRDQATGLSLYGSKEVLFNRSDTPRTDNA